MLSRDGQGKTLGEIKASTHQVVKAPMSYNNLEQQLKFFAGAS